VSDDDDRDRCPECGRGVVSVQRFDTDEFRLTPCRHSFDHDPFLDDEPPARENRDS
jgi:hypothetical protein